MKDLSALASFRIDAAPRPTWVPPVDEVADGTVLAFDQSLSATGWALLYCDGGSLFLLGAGSVLFKPKDYPAGAEGSLRKAVDLHDSMAGILDRCYVPGVTVVHEAPPAASRMVRPESSLMAALALRLALNEIHGPQPVVVQNQHSKKVLVNDVMVTKNGWHAGLVPFGISNGGLAHNEGERDAVCLALTHLIDKARGRG